MPRKQSSEQLLDEPMYAAAEAGRLVGLSATRVRRWLRGYSYDYRDTRRKQRPVIRRTGDADTIDKRVNNVSYSFRR